MSDKYNFKMCRVNMQDLGRKDKEKCYPVAVVLP